jgi:hypothetical protein
MPTSLLVLCAHVSAYEVVLHRWEQGDFSEHTALINYPSDLEEYATRTFRRLKHKQLELLGSEQSKSSDAEAKSNQPLND